MGFVRPGVAQAMKVVYGLELEKASLLHPYSAGARVSSCLHHLPIASRVPRAKGVAQVLGERLLTQLESSLQFLLACKNSLLGPTKKITTQACGSQPHLSSDKVHPFTAHHTVLCLQFSDPEGCRYLVLLCKSKLGKGACQRGALTISAVLPLTPNALRNAGKKWLAKRTAEPESTHTYSSSHTAASVP